MMKLNDQFVVVRENILIMYPIPNVSQDYRLFAQEERHKEISNLTTQTEVMPFFSNKRRLGDQKFYNRNSTIRPFVHNPNAMKDESGLKSKTYYFYTHCKI